MDPRVGHALALLLGITLTVGFYEGRRLVFNTMRAVQAASAELRGDAVAAPAGKRGDKKKGKKKAVEAVEDGRPPEAAQRKAAKKTRSGGGGAKQLSKKDQLRERLRERLAEMTPEEQAEVREVVMDRRDARRSDRELRREEMQLRRQERMAELGLTREDQLPFEERGAFDDGYDADAPVYEDEMLDALEDEIPLDDTAFPVD